MVIFSLFLFRFRSCLTLIISIIFSVSKTTLTLLSKHNLCQVVKLGILATEVKSLRIFLNIFVGFVFKTVIKDVNCAKNFLSFKFVKLSRTYQKLR